MSTFPIESVGFCAHYCPQGDWAFEFALRLARAHGLRLNIFHFIVDPYDPDARVPQALSAEDRARRAIQLERELRMYYDARLGDYLDAGFRLCEDPEWTELHRCLTKREFQVLVLGYPLYLATFGGVPIEKFVTHFVCPVVLVGPSSPLEIHLNQPAALIADKLTLGGKRYSVLQAVPTPSTEDCQPCRPGVGGLE